MKCFPEICYFVATHKDVTINYKYKCPTSKQSISWDSLTSIGEIWERYEVHWSDIRTNFIATNFCNLKMRKEKLVEKAFTNIHTSYKNRDWLNEQYILAAKNKDVYTIKKSRYLWYVELVFGALVAATVWNRGLTFGVKVQLEPWREISPSYKYNCCSTKSWFNTHYKFF